MCHYFGFFATLKKVMVFSMATFARGGWLNSDLLLRDSWAGYAQIVLSLKIYAIQISKSDANLSG